MPSHPVWSRRRHRVGRLRTEHPHAAELLAFYDDVLALQEPLYAKALKSRWLEAVEAADGRAPRLRLERLPERSRDRDFSRFVRAIPASATDVLRAMAERLMTEPAAMSALLSAVLAREPVDAVAARVGCDAAALEFFPRAFVQPVAEALAGQTDLDLSGARDESGDDTVAGSDDARAACPCCGAAPVAAVLRDEPEIKGRRTLLCSLCLTEWAYPRTRCPACGEQRAEKRPHHVSESWPHIRVEECGSCRTYIKAVDLREVGLAVPVVDELASIDLDLWAVGQGLTKLRANLLGM
ncbi:MAG: formate dehydrogenase accessory protein FdhE [Acidobacteria bacterium]|nr:formate dehydrogenase accessory protein FdhE [Acidobacteriota bacterium]